MATIKEIAEMVGVSSAAVSRVLNYDEGISVSPETKEAIFAAAEKVGYKKKVIYPKIENVVLLYWCEKIDELEDIYYQNFKKELIKQAARVNIDMTIVTREDGMSAIPKGTIAFIAIGWMNRKEINALYKICKKGVFIGTSPDEKLFDAVRPNLDSFVTQMVDYFMDNGITDVGFVGGTDRNIDTGEPSMDVREWSFRQSMLYYGHLNEKHIHITDSFTVDAGYKTGLEMVEKGDLPKAICVACDTLSVGLLQAFNEKGVSVPENVKVFSINDINVARYVSPPLTTFHVDHEAICEAALDLLRSKILGGSKITKTVFVNGLPVMRKST